MASKKSNAKKLFALSTEFTRAVAEYAISATMYSKMVDQTPHGNGHTIMVSPGFLADDGTTSFLRKFLSDKGHNPVSWDQGRNLRLNKALFESLDERVKDLYEESGEKVSLIGHSLGGLISLIVASRNPDYVRDVVTLGSPLRVGENREAVSKFLSKMFDIISSDEDKAFTEQLIDDLAPLEKLMARIDDIPVTAIYTEGDGVVDSDIAQIPETDLHKNIELHPLSSHIGLSTNLQVLTILADRLARPQGLMPEFDKTLYEFAFPSEKRAQTPSNKPKIS